MRSLRWSVVLVALTAGVGCASSESEGAGARAANPNPTAQGIGPNAETGPPARDMPGGGRGSMTSTKGK